MIFLFSFSLLSLYGGFTNAAFKDTRSQDYQWGPSKALLEHKNPYDLYKDWLDGKIPKPYKMSQAPNYPASAYIFLWPYASMSWDNARLFWAISNIIFTVLILIGLIRLFPIKRLDLQLLIIMLFIAGSAWRTTIGSGQHGLFALAFFIWAIIIANKSELLSGFFLSIAWFKYTITFPLSLFFLYRKNYKTLLVSAVIHIILTLFVSYWIDQPVTQFFFGSVQIAINLPGFGDIDIFSIIQRYDLPVYMAVCLGSILLAMVIAVGFHYQKKECNELLILSFLSLISLTLFFHLHYDFILLIFPLWLLFSSDILNKYSGYLVIWLVILNWYFVSVAFHLVRKFEYPIVLSFDYLLTLSIIIISYLVLVSIYRRITVDEVT